ncbi:uncharacterized protein METZ01_LOCUS517216, partial [marine metagenome]
FENTDLSSIVEISTRGWAGACCRCGPGLYVDQDSTRVSSHYRSG